MVDMKGPDYVDMKNVIFFQNLGNFAFFLFSERNGFILNQSAQSSFHIIVAQLHLGSKISLFL